MSTNRFTDPFLASIDDIRNSWAWFLTFGILLILFGAICIAGYTTATFATVLFVGWWLLFGGIVSLVHAFRVRKWSGFFLYLMSALLRGFTGYLLIRYPAAGAISLTLILASFLVVGGLFRAIGAGTLKFPRWGWAVFSGVISMALGIMLLAQMPVSSVWFLGFAIGVDLILDGVSLVAFATAMRHLPKIVGTRPARDSKAA